MKDLEKLLFIPILLLILIGCSKNKPPNTPVSPSGPSSGIVYESLSFSAHTTDPDDDDIAYQFDWGDDDLSAWGTYLSSGDSVTQNHTYSSTGTYEVRVKAKDVKDKESEWSPELQIEIVEGNSPPNTPQTPTGPLNGYVDSTYSFQTSATDPDGDSIAYQFDWGDGNQTIWSNYVSSGSSISREYSYSSASTYEIKVKAKDKEENESNWSDAHSISISSITNSPPNIPSTPSGADSGYADSTYSFQTSATDPDGDSVAYQFDWGDSTNSTWSDYVSSGNSVSMDHSYSSDGTYSVKSKARDVHGAESGWSSGHPITISIPNSPPYTPYAPSGPDSGYVDLTYNFSTSTSDPEGSNISYQFDWGDGTYSEWSSYVSSGDSVLIDHSYSSEGTYSVKSKAKDEEGAECGWSSGHPITITEISPGDKLWVFSTGDAIHSSPALGPDGTIYVGAGDNLYAINPNGTEKWVFSEPLDEVFSSPAIGEDGTIYVGSRDSSVYAINPNGTEKWRFAAGGEVDCSPAIGEDGTIYAGTHNNEFYAINPDGTKKWSFSTEEEIWNSSPAIGSDSIIYVGSWDDNLYAINPDSTEKWAFLCEGSVDASPAIGSDGTIYVGASDNNLYAINPNGTEKWRFPTGDMVLSSPAIGPDGTIYVGSCDGSIYAINPNGTEKWVFPIGSFSSYFQCSPAIGSDSTIYAGRADIFCAINPNGTEKWRFHTEEDWWTASSPAIGSDGTIYVGSGYGKLYAIYSSSGGLANSPWPMYHHDLEHTGRVKE